MFLEDSSRALNFIEKNIYNEKGVSFSQLNNALKTINSYYKQATDPNFKTHIKNAVENFLRDDIKRGIESIFTQNKTLYEDAQALFETALSDYAKMKDTLKLVDSLKVRDTRVSQAKAIKNILKYLDGQGSHGIAKENFLRLSENLPEELKAEFEVGFLGGSAGSVALTKGFKVLKEKPELKEAVKRELADTLAKGWESATNQYPLLKSLEPVKHIMQSQKGRIAQAGHIIDKTFLEQSIKVLRDNVESMPKELSKEEFLTKGLERVINKERFLEHLQKAKDSKQRMAFLNLVEPTMTKANIELDILTDNGESRKGYLKAFEYGENRDLFYLLVTQDKDKLLISGYPISKEKEIKRILKKAKSITFKEGVAFEEITNRPELNKSSTLKTDSTIDSKLLSKQGIDEVSLVKAQSKFKYDEKKLK